MKTVFLLHHVQVDESLPGGEDVKLVGAYSSRPKAEEAIKRLSVQPGFRETKQDFHIGEYEIDKDHWTEGFATIRHKI